MRQNKNIEYSGKQSPFNGVILTVIEYFVCLAGIKTYESSES